MKAAAAIVSSKRLLLPLVAALVTGFYGVDAAVLHRQEDTSIATQGGDRTIAKVIKLLQNMLDTSRTEGETERELFAKHKCYCDTERTAKTTTVEDLTEQIGILESAIAGLQAENAKLSGEVAKLAADMLANQKAQQQAITLRGNSHTAFQGEEGDLIGAIGKMQQAVDVLEELLGGKGGPGAGNFMLRRKSSTLLKLSSQVRSAMAAAAQFMPEEHQKKIGVFLQANVAWTTVDQSVTILGILKDIVTTFEGNLESARKADQEEQKAHDLYIGTMEDEYTKLETAHNGKLSLLGENDGGISSKKVQLDQAVIDKAAAEDFLVKLEDVCKAKAGEYQERRMLRANEEAAIAEAIAILNSDQAFATFGAVDATSTGPSEPPALLLQVRRDTRNSAEQAQVRRAVQELLLRVQAKASSARLAKVLAKTLVGENPFTVVLEEIDNVKELIQKEAAEDAKQKSWCDTEVPAVANDLSNKKSEIDGIEVDISNLNKTINNPVTGLKVQIGEAEVSLVQNQESQKTETATRKEENVAYKKDIANLVDAEDLLDKAVKVLKRYYDALAERTSGAGGAALNQEEPAPPPTWTGAYSGQSVKGGTDAISMLEFILTETQKELKTAHQDELTAQHDYEGSMDSLKTTEGNLEQTIVDLNVQLKEKEKELALAKEELQSAKEDKAAIEKYQLHITPGCNYIQMNFAIRETNRGTELGALDAAKGLIINSEGYKAAAAKEGEDKYGDCKADCVVDSTALACKACMADMSEADYCKAHPGTLGCA